jgi:RecT family
LELGKHVETVWPSINEIEVTAARTKEWAGMDPPQWGPLVTEKFHGRRKDRQKGWIDVVIEPTYPDYCMVTVYRLIGGARCPFSEPVYWKEGYGRVGGTALPNEMWQKRPHGQLHKVAKAASLRAAFPEEGDTTAEEMEGQTIEPRRLLRCRPIIGSRRSRRTTRSSTTTPKPARSGRALWNAGITNHGGIGALVCSMHICKEEKFEPIDEWVKANQAAITALLKDAPKIQCIACGGDRQAPRGNPRVARGNRGRRADAQAM